MDESGRPPSARNSRSRHEQQPPPPHPPTFSIYPNVLCRWNCRRCPSPPDDSLPPLPMPALLFPATTESLRLKNSRTEVPPSVLPSMQRPLSESGDDNVAGYSFSGEAPTQSRKQGGAHDGDDDDGPPLENNNQLMNRRNNQ
jgi:hypothetical protein